MGLDAIVRCRCWEEGKTAPCEFSNLLEISEEGLVELTAPYNRKNRDLYTAFRHWRETCCPHAGMVLQQVWVDNWFGVSEFKQALCEVGKDRFPTLLIEIPSLNGGLTDASASKECIGDLDAFLEAPPFGRQIFLVDAENGERLRRVTGDGSVFIRAPYKRRLFGGWKSHHIGLDRDGLFVRERDGKELLRGMNVEQVYHNERAIELVARESGARVTTTLGVNVRDVVTPDGEVHPRYPSLLRVEVRLDSVDEYRPIVSRLRTILEASVGSGNPVIWC